ncbi:MAG: GNAT family N-acetyltransferase [Chloroflexota bacterium]
MNTNQLIQYQLAIECIGLNHEGLLMRIPGPNPDDIARVYVYRNEAQYWVYFRHDVAPAIRSQIAALDQADVYHNHDTIRTLLAQDSPCEEMFMGQTYLFPAIPTASDFADVVPLTGEHHALLNDPIPAPIVEGNPLFAIIRDGKIVSACQSTGENDKAAESYVYTDEAHRRQGLGRQVTMAWAAHVMSAGKVAFYSHALSNVASAKVAQSLGLRPCFSCVNYA